MKILITLTLSILLAIGIVKFDFLLFKIITIFSVIALILILVYLE